MGRLSRKRKLKACDPFSGKKPEAEKLGEPPKDLKPFGCRSDIFALIKGGGKLTKRTKRKRELSRPKAGESAKAFEERMNFEIREVVAQKAKSLNRKFEKRKEYFKGKKARKRMRLSNPEKEAIPDFAPTERVRFGDVAREPPKLPLPRLPLGNKLVLKGLKREEEKADAI